MSELQPDNVLNNRYILERKLAEGGMGEVYLATDRLTGDHVALKQVKLEAVELEAVSTSADSMTVKHALAQEFRALASIRHPNIISVLDYGFYGDQQPFFTMDYLENLTDFKEGSSPLSIPTKIEYLIQLLQALEYLHRRGLLHRDIKPGNVAVDKGTVKVLDFGLSIDYDKFQSGENVEIVGTLAYMAPELLQGQFPTTASDLYAVGIMAYEVLTGKYPFNTRNGSQLIMDILSTEPDFSVLDTITLDSPVDYEDEYDTTAPTRVMKSKFDSDEIDPDFAEEYDNAGTPLAIIVRRLLAKSSGERYSRAYDVIQELSKAIGQPLTTESKVIRESFLQSARFVGRDRELTEFKEALENALVSRGSSWLIGGETGVGKSRLLDELRVQALIQGVVTVRGQAVAENSLPYQLWREPLRRMMIYTDVDDVDASILKDLVHDIERLLNREVPPADMLDGDKYQDRLQSSILSVFRKVKTPLLLLLEDVQWAEDSVEIIKRLASMVTELPIVLVASYRHEEAGSLSGELADLNLIHLDRLNRNDIRQLSESILGSVGNVRQITELLYRETSGNVYFIIEVLRTLAEQAGGLRNINEIPLPDDIAVGGIRQILQRRLDQVSDAGQDLLQLASLIGRELDVKILDQLKDGTNIDLWFVECTNAGIIELGDDGQWHFAHDRMRRLVEESISDEEAKDYHARIASAIESVYGSQPEQAYVLAKHWREAENIERELPYVHAAADYALHIGNLQDAREFYQRTLEIMDALGNPPSMADDRAKADVNLGKTLQYLGEYDAALELITSAVSHYRTTDNQEGLAKALLEEGEVLKRQGNLVRAHTLTDESLQIYTRLDQKSGMAYAMDRLCDILNEQGEYERATQIGEQGLQLAQELDDRIAMGSLMNNLGIIAFAQGNYESASTNFRNAEEIYRANGQRRAVATLALNLGSVAGQQGDLDTCHEYFKNALEEFQAIGERRLISFTFRNLGLVADMQENYQLATWYYEESLSIARAIGNMYEICNSLINLGDISLKLGDVSGAYAYHQEAIRLSHESSALPITLEALAHILPQLADVDLAIQASGHIFDSPAANQETNEANESALNVLKNGRSEEDIEALLQAGKDMNLDDLVAQILATPAKGIED